MQTASFNVLSYRPISGLRNTTKFQAHGGTKSAQYKEAINQALEFKQAWQQFKKDPTDPTHAQKYQEIRDRALKMLMSQTGYSQKELVSQAFNFASVAALGNILCMPGQKWQPGCLFPGDAETNYQKFEDQLKVLCGLDKTISEYTSNDNGLETLTLKLQKHFSNPEIATIYCTYGLLNYQLFKRPLVGERLLEKATALDNKMVVGEEPPHFPFLVGDP